MAGTIPYKPPKNHKKTQNSKNLVNTKSIFWHKFVCFPHMLKWATNSFFLNKIDVFSYPNHYYVHIDENVLGLKQPFNGTFLVFCWCKRQNMVRVALWTKPQHIWVQTKAFYPKRFSLHAGSHSTTSQRFSVNLPKWAIFALFLLFGAFWFSILNQTP